MAILVHKKIIEKTWSNIDGKAILLLGPINDTKICLSIQLLELFLMQDVIKSNQHLAVKDKSGWSSRFWKHQKF